MKTKKIVFLATLILTTLFASANAKGLLSGDSKSQVEQTTTVKKTFKLKNYTKSCCTRLVEFGLKEVDGYIKSKSNTGKSEITVWFNSSKCSAQDIIKAINSTGYTVLK